MMPAHILKIRKEFADAKLAGLKPWEIREARYRKFSVGDIVYYEVVGEPDHPLSKTKRYRIDYVYDGPIGLIPGYVVFTDREVA